MIIPLRQLTILCILAALIVIPSTAYNITLDSDLTKQFACNAPDDTFTVFHNYPTGPPGYSNPITMGAYTTSTAGKYSNLIRDVTRFDTDGLAIPEGHEITGVTLSIYITEIGQTLGDSPSLVICEFEPDSDVWDTPDYEKTHFSIEESNFFAISFDDLSVGWNNFTLIDAEDYINLSGYTNFGFVEGHDFTGTAPPFLSSKDNHIKISTEYSGARNGPNLIITTDVITPTPTPTPYPGNISVNILEKYSNAALINQAITLTPAAGGAGETKTSLYGETLHFGVVPGMEYWFNASRAGYQDYNETYTIPASPGIYNVYMERILTPIANHSYAHFSVVDQTNGGLIPNAEIRLSDGQTKLTNSAGYTWFSVNNSEQINYYVSKPSGYWPAYGAMNLTADESILVALQRYTGPTATATMPGWTPVTVPTTGTGVDPVVTLSAQLRQQNVQEGMDVWYTNLPFISQFLFLLFIIGGLGLMGGTRRN